MLLRSVPGSHYFFPNNHQLHQSRCPCMTLILYRLVTILTRFSKTTPLILLRQALPPRCLPDSCSTTLPDPQHLHWSWSLHFHYLCLYVVLLLCAKPRSHLNCTDVWTINAVAQDDFSDVEIPDAPAAPAQPPHSPHTGVEKSISAAALNERKEERLKSRDA